MFRITLIGDDRGLSGIKYSGDQEDFIDLNNPTDLKIIKYWINCIDMIDNYYQENDGKFPLKELKEVLL